MVEIFVAYEGKLRCTATHGPSGAAFTTDAPKDNMGQGQSFSPTQQLRIFAGYAGWSPGQLEEEMKRDAWLTHPASLELLFNSNAEDFWQSILRQKGWKYRLLSQTPEDLSWQRRG